MLNTEYVLRYTPLVLILVVGPLFVGVALLAGRVLAPRQAEELKPTTYESGMPSQLGPFTQMNLRYYLYAILFVLFEVEILFILPWTLVVRGLGPAAFAEMMLFLGILLFGFAYAWRQGVLQWR